MMAESRMTSRRPRDVRTIGFGGFEVATALLLLFDFGRRLMAYVRLCSLHQSHPWRHPSGLDLIEIDRDNTVGKEPRCATDSEVALRGDVSVAP
jgi:hypothetical protein